jgi:uncharacterized membrane protein
MNYQQFIVGPHLIGVLFILLGLVQRYLPPKKINRFYGYRTLTARTNQKTWDEGNRYSALYMIKAGIILLIVGFVINALSILYISDPQQRQWIAYIVLFGGAMGIGILSTMATEKHLHRTFKIKKPVKRL